MNKNIKWLQKLRDARKKEPRLSLRAFARRNGVNYNTMRSYIHRGELAENKEGKSIEESLPEEVYENEDLHINEADNFQEVVYTSPLQQARIHTLDELMEFAKVDLEVWEVREWKPNVWTVTAKINGVFQTATNYQVKASMIRKQPLQVNLSISPVQISNINLKPPKLAKKTGLRCSVALMDGHIGFSRERSGNLQPYQDRLAIATSISVMEYLDNKFKLNEIIFGGDWLDLAEWSMKFVTRPEFYGTTQPALNEMAWLLGYLRLKFPNTRIIYLDGNHEKRVEDYMIQHLGWAYNLKPGDVPNASNLDIFTIRNMLGLDRLGVEYYGGYPNNDFWVTDNLRVSHGNTARAGKADTAKKMAVGAHYSTVFGHIHRTEHIETIVEGRGGRRVYQTVCPGCMCHTDERIPPVGSKKDWTNGFAVLWYDNDYEEIDSVSIRNGKAIYMGKSFEANSYYSDMKKEIENA